LIRQPCKHFLETPQSAILLLLLLLLSIPHFFYSEKSSIQPNPTAQKVASGTSAVSGFIPDPFACGRSSLTGCPGPLVGGVECGDPILLHAPQPGDQARVGGAQTQGVKGGGRVRLSPEGVRESGRWWWGGAPAPFFSWVPKQINPPNKGPPWTLGGTVFLGPQGWTSIRAVIHPFYHFPSNFP